MRDRLIELVKPFVSGSACEHESGSCELTNCRFCNARSLADNILANGVIVPPCKVGDAVWVNWENYGTGKKETHQASVYALRFDTKKNNMRICVEGNFEIKAYGGRFTHYYNATFAWNSVGKTVFLTKEEAEQALEGLK